MSNSDSDLSELDDSAFDEDDEVLEEMDNIEDQPDDGDVSMSDLECEWAVS